MYSSCLLTKLRQTSSYDFRLDLKSSKGPQFSISSSMFPCSFVRVPMYPARDLNMALSPSKRLLVFAIFKRELLLNCRGITTPPSDEASCTCFRRDLSGTGIQTYLLIRCKYSLQAVSNFYGGGKILNSLSDDNSINTRTFSL